MTGMHEVGDSLNALFDTMGPPVLLPQLQVVAERVTALQQGFNTITADSSQPAAEAVRQRLASIQHALGEVMMQVVAAEDDKNSLLRAWRLDELQTSGSSVIAPPEIPGPQPQTPPEVTTSKGGLFAERVQQQLGTELSQELAIVGKVRARQLAVSGVRTFRDVLVCGREHIQTARYIGPEIAGQIERWVAEHVPGVRLRYMPTPAYIATFCPTLQDVSWVALRHPNIQLRYGEQFKFIKPDVTLYDLLHAPARELIGDTPDEETVNTYQKLVAQARAFAADFETARNQQDNT